MTHIVLCSSSKGYVIDNWNGIFFILWESSLEKERSAWNYGPKPQI